MVRVTADFDNVLPADYRSGGFNVVTIRIPIVSGRPRVSEGERR